MTIEARVIFEPRANLCGADAIVVDGTHVFGFAGDTGKTELHVTSTLARTSVKKLPVKSWLRGVFAEGPDWFAGSDTGELYTSPDQGTTWRAHALPTEQSIRAVVRLDGTLWVAGAAGFVAHEDDGGWAAITMPKLKAAPDVISTLHVDGHDIYVLGRGLWRITGGRSTLEVTSSDRLTGFTRTASGTRIVVGENGVVYRSEAGKPWKRGKAGLQDFVGVVELGGTLLAARISALDNHALLAISDDDGKTFTSLPLVTRDGRDRYDGDRLGCLCVVADGHGGAFVSGFQGMLVRVGRDGLGPWRDGNAKPATNADAEAAKAVRSAARKNRVSVVSPELHVRAIASNGEALFLANYQLGVIRDGATIEWKESIAGAEAVCAFGSEVWASGKGLWCSTNRGKTFAAQALPKQVDPSAWACELHGIARDPSGVLWAAGHHVIAGKPGEPWKRITELGADARVKAASTTTLGAVLLTFTGKAWLANATTLSPLRVTGAGHLSSAVVTPSGTLIVVGTVRKKWAGLVKRFTSQGKQLAAGELPSKTPPLLAVAAFPDGRVIAAGEEGTLLVSMNDGASFAPLPVASTSKRMATGHVPGFEALCLHDGAIYAGGPVQSLVRIE